MTCPRYRPTRISPQTDVREARRWLARMLADGGPRTVEQLRWRRAWHASHEFLRTLLRHDWFTPDAGGRYSVTDCCYVMYLDPLRKNGRVRI